MRREVDERRVRELAERLGRVASPGTRLYLTGGATAVLEGWRPSTVDVDLRIEPEDDLLMREIPRVKNDLDINIEFASPIDFLPELPGWRERSRFVTRADNLEVFQFDPYSQALAKVERGFDVDLSDVRSMVDTGLIDPIRALELFAAIETDLYRFPAIDPETFKRRVHETFAAA